MDKQKKTKRDRGKRRGSLNSNPDKPNPKTHKETNKISEIIRTVKKNSSMRLKGSRNSKAASNKELSDSSEMPSKQTNMTEYGEVRVVPDSDTVGVDNEGNKTVSDLSSVSVKETPETKDSKNLPLYNGKCDPIDNMEKGIERSIGTANEVTDFVANSTKDNSTIVNKFIESKLSDDTLTSLPKIVASDKERNRKLSLDHTILLRGESFTQSEMELNSVGKLPLERKSSFFRKKMESFLKNTSEVFRRQSVKRKGSMSLQSLPEHCGLLRGGNTLSQDIHRGSITSLSSYTLAGSEWSLNSKTQDSLRDQASVAEDHTSLVGSQSSIGPSQTSDSIQSLNEAYQLEAYLNSRAQSVSSGLDTATQGTRRRKATNRANRVTWLASEGLTNYLRRLIQDEEGRKSQNSNQDSSSGQEFGSKLDSRGRRLSYQRAVSGEDPVRYLDSLRRPLIPEQPETGQDLTTTLHLFTRNGIPALRGFRLATISEGALFWLHQINADTTFTDYVDCAGLTQQEESRQAAITELIVTEVEYIKHLRGIVEIFIATLHALQDSGILLTVDTARLFSNVPDILNVNLQFWEAAFYPLINDATETCGLFRTSLMVAAFDRFDEHFQPYEKFVSEHLKALEYLKILNTQEDFQLYLSWCYSNRSLSHRLQLSDILIKPMQRLTKYPLMLNRINQYTDAEDDKAKLSIMENRSKSCINDINRSIRQREELEKMETVIDQIDSFEIDFRDEEMNILFRDHCNHNLRVPMLNCCPTVSRTLIYEGDHRLRDSLNQAKIDVHLLLFTDLLLVCKKLGPKFQPLLYKIIRPKIMMYKVNHHICPGKNQKDGMSIAFVILDDLGSGCDCLTIYEPSKNSDPLLMKTFEMKIREAKITYEMTVWAYRNPSRDLSEKWDCSSNSIRAVIGKLTPEDIALERAARERTSAMLYRGPGASASDSTLESFDGSGGGQTSSLRHPMFRTSTGSSRVSSSYLSQSSASRDESIDYRNLYTAGSSVEHVIPAQHPEEAATSITVNVVSESDTTETIRASEVSPTSSVTARSSSPNAAISKSTGAIPKTTARPPTLKALKLKASPVPRPVSKPSSRSSSYSKQHTLKVQPQRGVMALVHSLPDLTLDPTPQRQSQCPSPQSASAMLYESHRNRLAATSYLSPDHRGSSYPPPSPTRALLTRSFAFSQSMKPPLSKMGHVNSQSTLQSDTGSITTSTVTVQIEDETGVVNPMLVPRPRRERERPLSWVPGSSRDFSSVSSPSTSPVHGSTLDISLVHDSARDISPVHGSALDISLVHDSARDISPVHVSARDISPVRNFSPAHVSSRNISPAPGSQWDITAVAGPSREFPAVPSPFKDIPEQGESINDDDVIISEPDDLDEIRSASGDSDQAKPPPIPPRAARTDFTVSGSTFFTSGGWHKFDGSG